MSIYHRLRLATICVLATTALLASVAIAKTELITNGTFDSNTSGWSNSTSGSISWNSTEGHTTTGAAETQNTRAGSSTFSAGGTQCINLPTPVAGYYTVEGWAKVPSQSNNTAEGFIRFHFYSSLDCGTAIGSDRDTPSVSVGSDWTQVSKIGSTTNGAQSVQVRLYVKKSAIGDAYAYFDDISFFSSTATAVTLSSLAAHSRHSAAQLERVLTALVHWPAAALAGIALMAASALLVIRRLRPRA